MSKELGFYIGIGQFGYLPNGNFVFDTKTHLYKHDLMQEDIDRWKALNNKIIKESKKKP